MSVVPYIIWIALAIATVGLMVVFPGDDYQDGVRSIGRTNARRLIAFVILTYVTSVAYVLASLKWNVPPLF